MWGRDLQVAMISARWYRLGENLPTLEVALRADDGAISLVVVRCVAMAYTVFYAWQEDRDTERNKKFVRKAIEKAVARVAKDSTIEDSPRLDHDTKGLPGTPEIAASIFAKITECGVFVADVTCVASTTTHDGRTKMLPNANVLVELGFAASAIGWDRIVLVMNEAYGGAQYLPFDVQHRRRPFVYTLEDVGDRAAKLTELSEDMEGAIRAAANVPHEAARRKLALLDTHCLDLMMRHARKKRIALPDIDQAFGQAIAMMHRHLAWRRLLELGLVSVARPSFSEFHYEWTFQGRLALRGLGLLDESVSDAEYEAVLQLGDLKPGETVEMSNAAVEALVAKASRPPPTLGSGARDENGDAAE
jgi:hypothetical protein